MNNLNVLVYGSGGREHAICWKLKQSPLLLNLYCTLGNAGIAQIADIVDANQYQDYPGLMQWCKTNDIHLIVVGPEAPLVDGLVNLACEYGIPAFGPSKSAAQLEGSKKFAKEIMISANVPTAAYRVFYQANEALSFAKKLNGNCVVKADGLAAGKGVFVCNTLPDAEFAIKSCLVDKIFGEAGSSIIIEEKLIGIEASITALTDGTNILLLPSSQDHKRILDGDKGPNTGGMGTFSPNPLITEQLMHQIEHTILHPTLTELKKRNIKYSGVLYAGLMITKSGIKVLEFNCRFGDPESQVILPLIKADLLPVLYDIAVGNAINTPLQLSNQAAVCVVMASEGYPNHYTKGIEITGLQGLTQMQDVIIFHAGTKYDNGKIVTNGGRVLGVTAVGNNLTEAHDRAYQAINHVKFTGTQYRKDIAKSAIRL